MKKTNEDSGIIDRAWELQHNIEARQKRIGKGKYGRVLKMARNPSNEEYEKTSKITGAGILIIGGVGFLIFLLSTQVAPWIGELLGLMTINGFNTFVTIDKNLKHQQNIERFPLQLFILNAPNNTLKTLEPYIAKLKNVLVEKVKDSIVEISI